MLHQNYDFLLFRVVFTFYLDILTLCVLAVGLKSHFVLDYILTFIESTFSLNILFYGAFDDEIFQFLSIVFGLGSPIVRRHNLNI